MGNCCSVCCRNTSEIDSPGDFTVIKKSEIPGFVDEILNEHMKNINKRLDKIEYLAKMVNQHVEDTNKRLDKIELDLYGDDESQRKLLYRENINGIKYQEFQRKSDRQNFALDRTSGFEHINHGATLEGDLTDDPESAEERDTVVESIIKPVKENILRRHISGEDNKKEVHKPKIINSLHTENSLLNPMKFNFEKLDEHVNSQNKLEQLKQHIESIVMEVVGPKAIYVGSAFENLHVGQPYEFDIQWPFEEDCRVEYNNNNISLYDTFDSMITPEIVQERQREILILKLQNLKLPKNWKLFGNDVKSSIFIHRKGFQVGFTFSSDMNSANKFEMIGVLLDLIPCYVIPLTLVQEHNLLNSEDLVKLNTFLSKVSRTKWNINESDLHLVFDGKESWKISTSLIEKAFLSVVPDQCKQQYRVLKYLTRSYIPGELGPFTTIEIPGNRARTLFGLESLMHSYCLKNEFLKLLIKIIDKESPNIHIHSYNIAARLLEELSIVYQKDGTQRMKKKRHFLLLRQEVDIMETHKHSQEVSNKLQYIKKHLMECEDIDIQKYPLLNFPKCKIVLPKPLDLPPKPRLLRD